MFNWFWEFLYGLIRVPLFCIDVILIVARKLCGIDPVQVKTEINGEVVVEDTDLLSYFMKGETILNSFGYVCLFAFIFLFLFTAFRVLRDQLSFYEKKSPIRICLESAKILLMFLLVPAIMIAGTAFVTVIMEGIYTATANSNTGLGGSMFVIFAEEAYIGPAQEKETILNAFRTCSLEDYINRTNMHSYYNVEMVKEYFKISNLNFFLGFVGSISVVILLGLTMLSFVERIISLVLLFIIAPLPMSVAPLDDGERFKMWREQTINKFITAYGGLLALNVFALMLPMIAKIDFLPITGSLGSVINGIARLLFIIGGAFACRRGMVLVGNLVSRGAGSQDLMDQSHLSGGMASLAHMASGAVKGAFGLVTGAARGSFNKGRSWLQAAEIPTSIAEGIRYHTQDRKERAAEERRASANRFDGRVDRGGQGGTNLQAVMQANSPNSPNSAKTSQATAKIGNPITPIQPPAFHEKNNDANKNAQSDIKNALQNSKPQDKPDNNSHTT